MTRVSGRSPEVRDREFAAQEAAARFGVEAEELNSAALSDLEPHLVGTLSGGLRYPAPATLANPLALTRAYVDLFMSRGGRVLQGDAFSLAESAGRWTVRAEGNELATASQVVSALGPWSGKLFKALGYRLPFFVKRGYHVHFEARGNAILHNPVLDVEGGYMLAPMDQGIRLTTGAEFTTLDRPASLIPLNRVEPIARSLFPLAEQKETTPWMGNRPALPDMLPIIGPAPRHGGLWFACGHAHHGLTLGAVTGHLVAEMVTGQKPFTDPSPYRLDRFDRSR